MCRAGIPSIDLVIVRENTEGLYSGLEHTVIPGVVESLKDRYRKSDAAYLPVRIRVRSGEWSKKGNVHSQGEHHEAL